MLFSGELLRKEVMEETRLLQWSVIRSIIAIVQWWGFNVTVIIMNKWIFQVSFCFFLLNSSVFIYLYVCLFCFFLVLFDVGSVLNFTSFQLLHTCLYNGFDRIVRN